MGDTIKASPTGLVGGSGQYTAHAQKITDVGQALDQVTRSVLSGTDGSLWGSFPQSLTTTHQKLQASLECAGADFKSISSNLTVAAQAFSKLDAHLAAAFQSLAGQAPLYTGFTSGTAEAMPVIPRYKDPFPQPTGHSESGWAIAGQVLVGLAMVGSAFVPPLWEDEAPLALTEGSLAGADAATAGTEGAITAGGALDGSELVLNSAGLSVSDAQILSQISSADDLLSLSTSVDTAGLSAQDAYDLQNVDSIVSSLSEGMGAQ